MLIIRVENNSLGEFGFLIGTFIVESKEDFPAVLKLCASIGKYKDFDQGVFDDEDNEAERISPTIVGFAYEITGQGELSEDYVIDLGDKNPTLVPYFLGGE